MATRVSTTRWFLRGISSVAHRNIKHALGVQDTADETRLNESVSTADGEHDLWECTDKGEAGVKSLALDFLQGGQMVMVYRKAGDDLPAWWEDDDLTEARIALELPKPKCDPWQPPKPSTATIPPGVFTGQNLFGGSAS